MAKKSSFCCWVINDTSGCGGVGTGQTEVGTGNMKAVLDKGSFLKGKVSFGSSLIRPVKSYGALGGDGIESDG